MQFPLQYTNWTNCKYCIDRNHEELNENLQYPTEYSNTISNKPRIFCNQCRCSKIPGKFGNKQICRCSHMPNPILKAHLPQKEENCFCYYCSSNRFQLRNHEDQTECNPEQAQESHCRLAPPTATHSTQLRGRAANGCDRESEQPQDKGNQEQRKCYCFYCINECKLNVFEKQINTLEYNVNKLLNNNFSGSNTASLSHAMTDHYDFGQFNIGDSYVQYPQSFKRNVALLNEPILSMNFNGLHLRNFTVTLNQSLTHLTPTEIKLPLFSYNNRHVQFISQPNLMNYNYSLPEDPEFEQSDLYHAHALYNNVPSADYNQRELAKQQKQNHAEQFHLPKRTIKQATVNNSATSHIPLSNRYAALQKKPSSELPSKPNAATGTTATDTTTNHAIRHCDSNHKPNETTGQQDPTLKNQIIDLDTTNDEQIPPPTSFAQILTNSNGEQRKSPTRAATAKTTCTAPPKLVPHTESGYPHLVNFCRALKCACNNCKSTVQSLNHCLSPKNFKPELKKVCTYNQPKLGYYFHLRNLHAHRCCNCLFCFREYSNILTMLIKSQQSDLNLPQHNKSDLTPTTGDTNTPNKISPYNKQSARCVYKESNNPDQKYRQAFELLQHIRCQCLECSQKIHDKARIILGKNKGDNLNISIPPAEKLIYILTNVQAEEKKCKLMMRPQNLDNNANKLLATSFHLLCNCRTCFSMARNNIRHLTTTIPNFHKIFRISLNADQVTAATTMGSPPPPATLQPYKCQSHPGSSHHSSTQHTPQPSPQKSKDLADETLLQPKQLQINVTPLQASLLVPQSSENRPNSPTDSVRSQSSVISIDPDSVILTNTQPLSRATSPEFASTFTDPASVFDITTQFEAEFQDLTSNALDFPETRFGGAPNPQFALLIDQFTRVAKCKHCTQEYNLPTIKPTSVVKHYQKHHSLNITTDFRILCFCGYCEETKLLKEHIKIHALYPKVTRQTQRIEDLPVSSLDINSS